MQSIRCPIALQTAHRNLLLLILLFITSNVQVFSQTYEIGDLIEERIDLTPYCLTYTDSSASLPVSEILKKEFDPLKREVAIVPYSNFTSWYKVRVVNNSEKEDWVFFWDNCLVEEITVYKVSESGQVLGQKTRKPFTERSAAIFKGYEPSFDFKIYPNERAEFLVSLKGRRGHVSSLFLYQKSGFEVFSEKDLNFRGMVSGMMILRLLLVISIVFYLFKEIKIQAYSVVIIGRTAGYWALLNILGPMFSSVPETVMKIDFIGYSISPITGGIFMLAILPFKKLHRIFTYLIYAMILISTLQLVFTLVNFTAENMQITVYIIVISSLITYGIFIGCLIKRFRIHFLYSLPFLLGNLSYFLMNARLLDWLHFKGIFELAMLFFLAEFFFFILFLGQIFRDSERSLERAKRTLSFETKQKEKLKELDQLKTDFFTAISHELRTPLTLVAGPVNELTRKYPGDQLLTLLRNNVSKLQKLVNEILDIQKLEAGKSRPHITFENFGNFSRRVVSAFESHAQLNEIRLTTNCEPLSFHAYFDKNSVEKIMNNLISNALKFTPSNGEVSVSVRYDEVTELLSIRVSDTGIGIQSENLDRIFERFYRVRDEQAANRQGTGVGLALVRELVLLHKGSIRAESVYGSGTTFTVTIPTDYATWKEFIQESEEEDPELVEINGFNEAALPRTEDKPRILVVEDNPEMRDYLRILLQDNFEFTEASNGVEGLQIAGSQVPDIIITDLMMPKMHGTDFARSIRSNKVTSHIPIIMLTARVDKESRLENLSTGSDYYLTKPFDADELKAVLSSCLENRERVRRAFERNLVEPAKESEDVLPEERDFVGRLNNFIGERFGDSQLTVTEIADHMNISETQLRRKLKYLTKHSPNEYLRKYRLEKAAILLRKTDKNVSEVAFEVGFENLSYFSRMFQQAYGKLPSEYQSG